MRTGRYRGFDYDVIVIGAGIGGLTAGAYLARKGARVLLCEQRPRPGGCFNSFRRRGYTFDGGIQGCEDVGLLTPMLRQLGLRDELVLTRGRSAVATPDFFVPFPTYRELTGFYRGLEGIYPGESRALREIGREVQVLCRFFEALLKSPSPFFRSFREMARDTAAWLPRYGPALKDAGLFYRLLSIPVEDYLQKKFRDPRPAKLIAQMGYRGTSASIALPFFYFFTDYWYPRGGIQAIPNALARYIQDRGGEIRYRTLVEKIVLESGRARGIRTKSGDIIRAPFVISNGDARRTLLDMLPPEALPRSYRSQLRAAGLSESTFSVFLGLDIPPERLPLRGCQHVLYLPSYEGVDYDDVSANPDFYRHSFMMILAPSVEDPTLAPPGKSILVLQSAAVAEFADHWGTNHGRRTPRYREMKEKIARQLIANAEQIIPGLSEKIEVKITASPYTYERYTLNAGGSTGGWAKHPARTFAGSTRGLMHMFPPVKSLYLAGHWTSISGGVPTAIISGKIVSDVVNFRLRWGI